MRRTYKKPKQKRITWYIPVAVVLVTGFLGFQLLGLYSKLSTYEERKSELMVELEEAKAKEQELSDYEAYTETDEYFQNTARTKLGLVKENEIIFKEK